VCDVGLYAGTNASEFECRPVSAIKRTGYDQSHSAKYFFFFKNIYTKIFTHTDQNIYTYKSTPPSNLKCHISHNVTEFTKPREWVNSGVT
jgi:hypothetical protein